MRAAIYARFSSDQQRDASIEDQVRVCTALVERMGGSAVQVFSDYAISGSTQLRPGFQQMLLAVRDGRVDMVVAEALDRLSRDQEHVAGFYKQMMFAGTKIVTVSEGEISELHVGLKGTMNALFLKDLGQKTHRGLEGRARQGKAAGGKAFGYRSVQQFDGRGEPVRGERVIEPDEASVVLRIFSEYADGRSPRAIAFALNEDRIPAPLSDKAWSPSTIYGNWRRGTGILNNELYVGWMVWNRQHFIKDPGTGKRQARLNPPEQWVRTEVTDLRIVPQDLWERVKSRQGVHRQQRPERARRPTHILSGLMVCGECGGGFSMISANHYGCSRARNTGTCGNRLIIRRDTLEELVLDGLRRHLMQPAAVKEFVTEFTRDFNRLAADHDSRRTRLMAEHGRITVQQKKLIEAIKDGTPARLVNAEMIALENRYQEIEADLSSAPPPLPRLHPNLADLYRSKVEDLQNALNEPDMAPQAGMALRGLIDRIRMVPVDGKLEIELLGARAAMLALGTPESKHPRGVTSGVQEALVAGAGFEPAAFRL